MRQEESFGDYDTGFRRGIFDKANDRHILTDTELLAYGDIFSGGYRDGCNSTDTHIVAAEPKDKLEHLWLDIHRARYQDDFVRVMGNDACSAAVEQTLEYLARNNFLTLPPEPSREKVVAYTRWAFGDYEADMIGEDYA